MKTSKLLLSALLATTTILAGCGRSVVGSRLPASTSSALAAAAADEVPTLPAVVTPELRKMARDAEKLMGKKLVYKNDAELDAYLKSVASAVPTSSFDRDHFLASIGVKNVKAPGRQDPATLEAACAVEGFRPGTIVAGHELVSQAIAFKVAKANPKFFLNAIKVTNPAIEATSRAKGLWKKAFTPKQVAQPINESPREHYAGALAQRGGGMSARFDEDFHAGLPPLNEPDQLSYGTYTIARSLGFNQEQAHRIAENTFGIDKNTTPYGKTSPSPLDQMDRHFNLDRGGQDTRYVWASRHLEAAKWYAKQHAYDQAEIELGCGLHSLQDSFAHGQLSTCMHGVLGEFPDQVTYDAIAFYEATGATVAYLKAYLKAL